MKPYVAGGPIYADASGFPANPTIPAVRGVWVCPSNPTHCPPHEKYEWGLYDYMTSWYSYFGRFDLWSTNKTSHPDLVTRNTWNQSGFSRRTCSGFGGTSTGATTTAVADRLIMLRS